MKLTYKCQFTDNTYELILNDKSWGISQAQAKTNYEALRNIVKDKPNMKELKKSNFKLWQTIELFIKHRNFINKYFCNTKLTKQMKCLILLKSVRDWNEHTIKYWNKVWYSQMCSICGCSYNTPRNTKYLLDKLYTDTNRTKWSSYCWYDFINYLYNQRCKLHNKERTIIKLYKADLQEGLLSNRIKPEKKRLVYEPTKKVKPINNYFGETILESI